MYFYCHEIRGREVACYVCSVQGVEPLVEGVIESEVKLARVPDRLLKLAEDVSIWADLRLGEAKL